MVRPVRGRSLAAAEPHAAPAPGRAGGAVGACSDRAAWKGHGYGCYGGVADLQMTHANTAKCPLPDDHTTTQIEPKRPQPYRQPAGAGPRAPNRPPPPNRANDIRRPPGAHRYHRSREV